MNINTTTAELCNPPNEETRPWTVVHSANNDFSRWREAGLGQSRSRMSSATPVELLQGSPISSTMPLGLTRPLRNALKPTDKKAQVLSILKEALEILDDDNDEVEISGDGADSNDVQSSH